jgi:hypothetical protein
MPWDLVYVLSWDLSPLLLLPNLYMVPVHELQLERSVICWDRHSVSNWEQSYSNHEWISHRYKNKNFISKACVQTVIGHKQFSLISNYRNLVQHKDTLHNLGTISHSTRIRQQTYSMANHIYLHNVPLFTLFLLKWIENNMKIIIFSHQVTYLHSIFHWVQSITTKLQQLPKLHFHASMLTASYLRLMSSAQFISGSTYYSQYYTGMFKTFTATLACGPFLRKGSRLMKSPYHVHVSPAPHFGIWTTWLIFTKLGINVTWLDTTQSYFFNFLQSIIQRWHCAKLLVTLEPLNLWSWSDIQVQETCNFC